MSTTEDMQARVADYEILCHRCRLGDFDNCERRWGAESECPGEGPTAAEYLLALRYVEIAMAAEATASPSRKKSERDPVIDTALEQPQRGDSGYIHPDAWTSKSNIGELADAESVGRKRVAKMYPIQPGQVCEWARLKGGLSGSPVEIIGCLGNPATDLHHGPDKNTLNNEKGSLGVGVNDNVWMICSSCHNKAHAVMDPMYPSYDRNEDQHRPWLPDYGTHGPPAPIVAATIDELLGEERRRLEDEARRGREKRGRTKGPVVPDTAFTEGEE